MKYVFLVKIHLAKSNRDPDRHRATFFWLPWIRILRQTAGSGSTTLIKGKYLAGQAGDDRVWQVNTGQHNIVIHVTVWFHLPNTQLVHYCLCKKANTQLH
jgi:hypothetical protein